MTDLRGESPVCRSRRPRRAPQTRGIAAPDTPSALTCRPTNTRLRRPPRSHAQLLQRTSPRPQPPPHRLTRMPSTLLTPPAARHTSCRAPHADYALICAALPTLAAQICTYRGIHALFSAFLSHDSEHQIPTPPSVCAPTRRHQAWRCACHRVASSSGQAAAAFILCLHGRTHAHHASTTTCCVAAAPSTSSLPTHNTAVPTHNRYQGLLEPTRIYSSLRDAHHTDGVTARLALVAIRRSHTADTEARDLHASPPPSALEPRRPSTCSTPHAHYGTACRPNQHRSGHARHCERP